MLVAGIAEEIALEIDREIIKELFGPCSSPGRAPDS